jgi:hypothetical protein
VRARRSRKCKRLRGIIEYGVKVDVGRGDRVISPKLDLFSVAVQRNHPLVLQWSAEVRLEQNHPGELIEATTPGRVAMHALTEVDEIVVNLKECSGKTARPNQVH